MTNISQEITELYKSYEKLAEIFDDAAEDGDLQKLKSLTTPLRVSKLGAGLKHQILNDTMDTAYRGTQMDPPVQGCSEMVEYLRKKGIEVPTYSFHMVPARVADLVEQKVVANTQQKCVDGGTIDCGMKSHVDRIGIGMEKFARIFCREIEEEKSVIQPAEFFNLQPEHIKQRFYEIYTPLLNKLHIEMYRLFIPIADPQQFLKVMDDMEMGRSVISRIKGCTKIYDPK